MSRHAAGQPVEHVSREVEFIPARPDPLYGPIVVTEHAGWLATLGRLWVKRGERGAETVVGLQQALHSFELERVSQPVAVTLTVTPPGGLPAVMALCGRRWAAAA